MKQEIVLTDHGRRNKVSAFRLVAETPEEYGLLARTFAACVEGPGLLSLCLDSETQSLTFEDIDLEVEGMNYKKQNPDLGKGL